VSGEASDVKKLRSIEAENAGLNEVCPHSSLQYMTPAEFLQQHATSTNPRAALK
jgi:hypothetical protein